MIKGERGIKKTTKIDATISKNRKEKQAQRYNIKKSQEKKAHKRRPTPHAVGYRLQSTLWAAGCIVGSKGHCGCVGIS